MKRLTEEEFYAVWERVIVENTSFYECRKIYQGLCASDREKLFMSVLFNGAVGWQIERDGRDELVIRNKNRGGSAYKKYKLVHDLAWRYLRRKRRHAPGYFPGKAATEVRKHCLKHRARFRYIPAQKTIKNNLKKKLEASA